MAQMAKSHLEEREASTKQKPINHLTQTGELTKITLYYTAPEKSARPPIGETGSWGRLGFLKQQYPTVPLLLLTATASSANIEAIRIILNIEQNNFEIIYSTNLLYQKIQYEIISKKNRKDTIIEEMAKMISTIKDSKSIIYCARKKNCEEIRDVL
ncbi:hypothetical protein C2G38_2227283 [Gigaspora rosea]|uniref:DNA 3'-5' helicase n=1 Tax=Gigaspora rosea TaxID=44941 RepID=A0A397TX70_9GLOM|nr:hypothetical protein C2G38_2227283 [Gigaspora rosea]